MKNYKDKIFCGIINKKRRSTKFLDYSNYACVNDAFQDFVTKFLSIVNFVALIKIVKIKSNAKLWFDIDI